MRVTDTVNMVKRRDDTEIIVNLEDEEIIICKDDSAYQPVFEIYEKLRMEKSEREKLYRELEEQFLSAIKGLVTDDGIDNSTLFLKGLEQLIDFFKEFSFEPNFRFVNTLGFKIAESKDSARDYINNYFALMDNGYANEIKQKMKSKEFDRILDRISANGIPNSRVNNRLKVYYGSAGTGKTTLAQKESSGRCVVCNASMLPSDLMEDFVFENGQPSFQPSTLWECMVDGKPIVLDEVNLLPFDSLRFLQGILDGKKELDYKGHKIIIADGFQVIGTMNLTIGGMAYGLPEPLVDRTCDIKEFRLSAEQLKGAWE